MKKVYVILLTAMTICSFVSTQTGQKRPRQAGGPVTRSKQARFSQGNRKILNENLAQAVINGDLRQATHFLNMGADPNTNAPVRSNMFSPITIPLVVEAVNLEEENTAIAMIRLLHRYGAILAKPYSTENNALYAAASKRGGAGIVRCLLQLGADRNHPFDSAEESPLHGAARAGNVAAMKALVRGLSSEQQKRLLQQKGCDGWTPIHCAADAAQSNALAWLCEQRIDLAPIDDNGNTPMHLLAGGYWLPNSVTEGTSRSFENYQSSITIFLSWHRLRSDGTSTLFQPNLVGLLPVHIAAQRSVKLVQLLSFCEASKSAQTPLGDTLFSLASPELRRELRKTPLQSTNEWTPLMLVAHATTQFNENSKQRLRTAVAEEQHPTHVTSAFDSALSVAGCEEARPFIREQIRIKVRDMIATHTFDKNMSEIILNYAGGYDLQTLNAYLKANPFA